MTQQTINVGAAPNDGTGDPARTAFTKCNDNFTELYQRAPQCGRLAFVSATALSFKPYNGDRIKINGVIHAIPAAGIAGLTNGGLSALTIYYVYAFNSSGTITGEFSATAHATSATAGNVGTEIKSGDDTRTLIGMVRTNASSQFVDDFNRNVISWFSRRNLALQGAGTGSVGTTSGTFVELNTAARITFLTWGDESVISSIYGNVINPTSSVNYVQIKVDGTDSLVPISNFTTSNATYGIFAGTACLNLAEGYHYATPAGATSAGTATFNAAVSAMIRG